MQSVRPSMHPPIRQSGARKVCSFIILHSTGQMLIW
jgi:hypothetical protein